MTRGGRTDTSAKQGAEGRVAARGSAARAGAWQGHRRTRQRQRWRAATQLTGRAIG